MVARGRTHAQGHTAAGLLRRGKHICSAPSLLLNIATLASGKSPTVQCWSNGWVNCGEAPTIEPHRAMTDGGTEITHNNLHKSQKWAGVEGKSPKTTIKISKSQRCVSMFMVRREGGKGGREGERKEEERRKKTRQAPPRTIWGRASVGLVEPQRISETGHVLTGRAESWVHGSLLLNRNKNKY